MISIIVYIAKKNELTYFAILLHSTSFTWHSPVKNNEIKTSEPNMKIILNFTN